MVDLWAGLMVGELAQKKVVSMDDWWEMLKVVLMADEMVEY